MEKDNIFYGRTKEDAIRKAVKQLNANIEDLDYEVIEDEETKKTMFSILDNKKVKIRAEVNEERKNSRIKANINKNKNRKKNQKNRARSSEMIDENIEFLEKVLENLKEEYKKQGFEYSIEKEDDNISINIDIEKNAGNWIGYKGKTLNSLQKVFSAMLNANFEKSARVFLNIAGYKEERKKQLERLADKVTMSVMKTGNSVTLEPMNSYERRIIHNYVSKYDGLKSESIGEEPNRKVVIKNIVLK